jgi:hypothetical protein
MAVGIMDTPWRPRRWRTLVAFLVGPIAPSLLLVLIVLLMGLAAEPGYWYLSAGILLMLGYPSTLIFGVPLYLTLRRWIWSNWWVAAAVGAMWAIVELTGIGVATLLLQGRQPRLDLGGSELLGFVKLWSIGLATGASGGLSFWFVGSFGANREPNRASIFA